MNDEPRYVILGRASDPAAHVGHTQGEWDRLLGATNIPDPAARLAAVQAVVEASAYPTAMQRERAGRRTAPTATNRAPSPYAIDAAGINAARKTRRAARKAGKQ